MKHKVVIAVAQQIFEFEGLITEITDDTIVIQARHGNIYLERKYLVFMQEINEEIKQETITKTNQEKVKVDQAAKFIKKQLRYDPLKEKLDVQENELIQKMDRNEYINDDLEVEKNVVGHNFGPNHPLVKEISLEQAVRSTMNNDEFTMRGNEYSSPLQTIMGLKNAPKKV